MPWNQVRPYPAGGERQSINKAFDKPFATIEPREEDGKTVLFSTTCSTGDQHDLRLSSPGMTERALLRRFLVMVRQWMLRHDIGLHAITVDDLVAYAMAGVERAARGDVGGHAGHSRSESTRAAYERRIDELFAGARPNREGVRLLDESDVLTIAGYGAMPVVLNENHAFGDGQYNHPLTIEQWKKLPDWISNPAFVGERLSDGHLTFIAPEKDEKGRAIVIGMSPSASKPGGYTGTDRRHLVLTVYPKDRGTMPLRARIADGDMMPVYVDQRKGPSFFDGSGVQFPGSVAELRASNKSLKTDRDLVKFRQARDAGEPRFSRAGLRTVARRATAEINQALNASGKVHWWHKTVGTMYNLAERAPAFKPVFEAAQSFIEDVSYYAADAAERAPRLLPRLDTFRDIFKSPISAADNRAIARPIFEGTLVWTRDADGKCFERPKKAMNPFQLVRPTCSP